MTIVAIILGVVSAAALGALLVRSRLTHQLLRDTQLERDKNAQRERNKAAVRKITEAFNTGRVELVDEIVHPEVRDHSNPPDNIQAGFNGVKRQIVTLRQQFPDLKFEEEVLVAEDDRVVLRWKMIGTNTGEIYGRRPTDKQITHHGTEFCRCKDGKIVEHFDTADVMPFLDKLGLLDNEMMNMLTRVGVRKYQ